MNPDNFEQLYKSAEFKNAMCDKDFFISLIRSHIEIVNGVSENDLKKFGEALCCDVQRTYFSKQLTVLYCDLLTGSEGIYNHIRSSWTQQDFDELIGALKAISGNDLSVEHFDFIRSFCEHEYGSFIKSCVI